MQEGTLKKETGGETGSGDSKAARDGWKAEEIVEESVNKQPDETVREILRGDETKGNPDERDIAGGPDFEDTPHGRKETKKNSDEGGEK